MKTLKGQELLPSHYADFERQVNEAFWDILYSPIVSLVKKLLPRGTLPKELKNVGKEDALKSALKDGRVQMVEDRKSGKTRFLVLKPSRALADALRSFGAKFDDRIKAYTVDSSSVPAWVRAESSHYTLKSKTAHDELKKLLDKLERGMDSAVAGLTFDPKQVIKSVDKGWREAAKPLGFIPDLDETGEKVFALELEKNAKIPIRGWLQESIDRMRDQVEQNALEGYRAEGLAKRIRDEYGTTKSKANLIAHQETSNFMADFRKAKALDAGLPRFIWRVTRDLKVRPAHKKLDGRKFLYSDPPLIEGTDRKCLPGQDFRCRCFPGNSTLTFAEDVAAISKRLYCGGIVELKLSSGRTLRATPNHEVLTRTGWKAMGLLNVGDDVVNLISDGDVAPEANVDNSPASIAEIFGSIEHLFGSTRIRGSRSQFHGDGSDGDVDIVFTNNFLSTWRKPIVNKNVKHFSFAISSGYSICSGTRIQSDNPSPSQNHHFILSDCLVPKKERLTPSTNRNASLNQPAPYNNSFKSGPSRNGDFTLSPAISRDNGPRIKSETTLVVRNGSPLHGRERNTTLFKNSVKCLPIKPNGGSNLRTIGPQRYHLSRILNVRRENAVTHVYNLRTGLGWYCMEGIVVHNCVDLPVLEST